MHDLRFIGVDDAGAHLLLGDDDGNSFRVPVDETLHAATRGKTPSASATPAAPTHQRPAPVDPGAGLRPKDVQALIRAGHSAEVVAERAGWSVEKVHRYEGPILGERAYVAGLARQVRLRPRGGVHATASTLEARVSDRLQAREIEPATATWDSLRTPTGRWSVVVFFTAGGRERQARWEFDPLARTVSASDDEARWLSEDEDDHSPGPLPAPHLQNPSRPSRVYDVEAEGGIEAPQRRKRSEPVDLMSTMRERSSQRGRRRRSKASEAPGLDRVPDEALPLEDLAMTPEQAGEPPAAHPQAEPAIEPSSDHAADDTAEHSGAIADEAVLGAPDALRPETAGLVDEPLPLDIGQPDEPEQPSDSTDSTDSTDDGAAADDAPDVVDAASEAEHAAGATDDADDGDPALADAETPVSVSVAGEPVAPETHEVVGEALIEGSDEPAEPTTPPRRPASRKSGRPSVPSWDDIMFGKKSD